jgi:bacteriocin-like protein
MKRTPPKTVKPQVVTVRPLEDKDLKQVSGGIIQNIK